MLALPIFRESAAHDPARRLDARTRRTFRDQRSLAREPLHPEVIVILDFGSQTAQLIARPAREGRARSACCFICRQPADKIAALLPPGILPPGSRRASMNPRAHLRPPSSGSACRSWASATGCSSPATSWAVAWTAQPAASSGRAHLNILDKKDIFAAIPPRPRSG